MSYLTVLLVSVALGVDAFSAATCIGLVGFTKKQLVLVPLTVTAFHIFMPLLGLSLGFYLGNVAGPLAALIGAVVLISIGLSTVWKSIRELGWVKKGARQAEKCAVINISSPVSLLLLAASVSLDALTVGFGLGALRVDLILTVVTMGLVAGIMTAAGMFFGKGLSRAFGERAELIGGAILILIGLKILVG